MNFFDKKYILPALLLLFLFVVFIDANSTPVPMKIILGSPVHMPLSMIIIVSMAVGAGCSFAGFFLFKAIRGKMKNGKQD